jgi:O-antigen ligase
MTKTESTAWPSLILLHGLGFLLLLGLVLGLGRRTEYAIGAVLLSTAWLVFVVIRKWKRDSINIKLQIIDLLFALFVLLIILSFLVQGMDKSWVQTNAWFVPFYIIIPYICGRFMREADLILFSKGLALALSITIPVFLLSFLFVNDSYFHYRPQVAGTDEVAARISFLVAQVGVVMIYLLLTNVSSVRIRVVFLYLLLLCALAISLVFMGLRTLILISFCIVALGCFKAKWMSLQHRAIIAGIYVLFLVGANAVMIQANALASKNGSEIVVEVAKLADNSKSLSCEETLRKYNSVAIRLELIRDALKQFRASPIIGIGAGSFGQYSCWASPVAHPHNMLVQVLGDLGLVGGAILIAMVIISVRPQLSVSWQRHETKNLAFLFFSFSLFNALAGGNYFTSVDLWWSLGLIVAMNSPDVQLLPHATA